MHAIVFVEKPQSLKPQKDQAWNAIVSAIHGAALKYPGIEVLGEACLLVPMKESTEEFRAALGAASSGRYAYRVMYLKKKPKWIRSQPE